jgi:hypothetical protein
VYQGGMQTLYCPLCGQVMKRLEGEDHLTAYRAAYQEWATVTKKGSPPKLPDEGIPFLCEQGCFPKPLLLHHATAGFRFAPTPSSWSLSFRNPGVKDSHG